MSAFLSTIHYQVFQKMINQQELYRKLHTQLQMKSSTIQPFINTLPDGDLQDIIDHTQIHAWLNEHILQLNICISNIIENIKEATMLTEAQELCYEEGKAQAHGEYTSCKDVFHHLQSLALTGMPCDRGTTLLSQDDTSLCFQINLEVFTHILDKDCFMELRLAWMHGLLHNTPFTIKKTERSTFTIKQEDITCTI